MPHSVAKVPRSLFDEWLAADQRYREACVRYCLDTRYALSLGVNTANPRTDLARAWSCVEAAHRDLARATKACNEARTS